MSICQACAYAILSKSNGIDAASAPLPPATPGVFSATCSDKTNGWKKDSMTKQIGLIFAMPGHQTISYTNCAQLIETNLLHKVYPIIPNIQFSGCSILPQDLQPSGCLWCCCGRLRCRFAAVAAGWTAARAPAARSRISSMLRRAWAFWDGFG